MTEPTWGEMLRTRGRWWRRHLIARLLLLLLLLPVILLGLHCEGSLR